MSSSEGRSAPAANKSNPIINNGAPILGIRGMTKKYPGTVALDHVDLNFYRGKVNVLVGENGAGKSTLMKIIAGAEQPTDGNILLDGEPVHFNSPKAALKHGIGIIYQELSLCANLNISENLFLARELRNRYGLVDHPKQEKITADVLKRLSQSLDPKTPVHKLRVGQQQIVEIARSLKDEVNILIMDEPTSALSRNETDILIRFIKELTSQGVTIIYISHRLDECLEIGDYFMVLRDGKLVAESDAEGVTLGWIIKNMAGRESDELFPETNHKKSNLVLEIGNLCWPRPEGMGYFVDHVSFSLYAGEITGLYGLMGAGRTELLECIFGIHPAAYGKILLEGRPVENESIDRRIRNGLMLIPEERQRHGLIQTMSVAENMTLASLHAYMKLGFLSSESEKKSVESYVKKLFIKIADIRQSIISLSGGNQQKVVIAKSMLTNPKVLLMDEPTRGVDVGTRHDIFKIMSEITGNGSAVLFTSSDLREITEMSDRVLVMAKGKITADLRGDQITDNNILDASVGKLITTHNEN